MRIETTAPLPSLRLTVGWAFLSDGAPTVPRRCPDGQECPSYVDVSCWRQQLPVFFLPSESQAEADVGERVRGIFIQTPADSDAQFKVWRDQIVNSRAEVLRRHILRSIFSKNAKILSVHIPAFGNWHLEHDGRRPLIEVIAFLLSGHIAKRGIELAFLQNLPAELRIPAERRMRFPDRKWESSPGEYMHFQESSRTDL